MAATERVFVAQPVSTAGGRIIASPFQFYTTGEDRLRLVSVNSLTGVVLKMSWRFVDSQGAVQANVQTQTPNTDRTTKTTDFEIGVGAVLNLTLVATSGTPQIGQTFVIVQLVRGFGAAAIVLGTMLQGYVTSTQHLAWPGSPIQTSIEGPGCMRSFEGTTPVIGGEMLEAVPAGARWRLQSIKLHLVLNATAGSRYTSLVIQQSGVPTLQIINTTFAQPPFEAFMTWAPGFPHDAYGSNTYENLNPLPVNTFITEGDLFLTSSRGLLGTDQYYAPRVCVEEWLLIP